MLERTGVSITYTVGVAHAMQTGALSEQVTTSGLAILFAIASHADNSKGLCYPSQYVLAKEARMSVVSLNRNIKILVKAGHLKVTPRTIKSERGRNAKTTNLYQLLNIPRFTGKPAPRKIDTLTDRSWDNTLTQRN